MDAKLQRITEMMKEVEDKQQREREFVRAPPSVSVPCSYSRSLTVCSSAAAEGRHRVQTQV